MQRINCSNMSVCLNNYRNGATYFWLIYGSCFLFNTINWAENSNCVVPISTCKCLWRFLFSTLFGHLIPINVWSILQVRRKPDSYLRSYQMNFLHHYLENIFTCNCLYWNFRFFISCLSSTNVGLLDGVYTAQILTKLAVNKIKATPVIATEYQYLWNNTA